MSEAGAFKSAVVRLHAEKDASYGPAWKRRGEVISVIANIARKVDRLEQVAGGAPATRDENVFDTVVDLLVYTLKYETYLADQDAEVANGLFGQVPGPYSDGCAGFELLLDVLDLGAVDDVTDGQTLAAVSAIAMAAFNDLEGCFAPPAVPAGERLSRATVLAAAAVNVAAAVRREAPALYDDFLRSWKGSA